MRNLWIVIADAGRARIFSKLEDVDQLTVVHELDNPAGRVHTSALVTDRAGRFEKHGTNARSAAAPHTDPHEHQARAFAHQLDHLLEDAAQCGAFDALALIAPAHFLGLLRTQMKSALKSRLIWQIARDLTHLSTSDLETHIGQAIGFRDTVVALG